MQSFWFAGLVLLVVFGLGNAVPVNSDKLKIDDSLPVNVDKLSIDNDSETRLIVPPEMTSNYFEILKDRSEYDTNSTNAEKADSTPMNFLKSSDDTASNSDSLAQKPILAFDGSKQTPIFITIPIYIQSSNEGLPIITTSIEKVLPSQMTSKSLPEGLVKSEDKNKKESLSSVAENQQKQKITE